MSEVAIPKEKERKFYQPDFAALADFARSEAALVEIYRQPYLTVARGQALTVSEDRGRTYLTARTNARVMMFEVRNEEQAAKVRSYADPVTGFINMQPGWELRCREKTDDTPGSPTRGQQTYVLTVKGKNIDVPGETDARPELEFDTTVEDFERIDDKCEGFVTKNRYSIVLGHNPTTDQPVVLEVDEYLKFPDRWVTELELKGGLKIARDEEGLDYLYEGSGRVFELDGQVWAVLPECLRGAHDVTANKDFSNGRLALAEVFPAVTPGLV